ncbi:MAG: aspartate--tRNA ligase [Patescibacteria group bacterium]
MENKNPILRTLSTNLGDQVNKQVKLAGWIAGRRDHGKLIFIDLRDRSGEVQMVVLPQSAAYQLANTIRPEWVIEVTGQVNSRPEKTINPNVINGRIEIEVKTIAVLNQTTTPPFDLTTDGYEIGEEERLRFRYLDLRRPRLRANLTFRHRINKLIRDFLSVRDFVEVETPVLTKSTPEGARDYVVPSRLYNGKFYALPQSPQQYKQLLMTAGLERYFQIARCFRDEDTRGDRQPEFTQLDLEMSFVDREKVMTLNEELLTEIVANLVPEKKIQTKPFPRLTYHQAMEQYGTDRPDLRTDKSDNNTLAFCWVIDFPFFERDKAGHWTFTHNPFSAPIPEHRDWLNDETKTGDILTNQYDIVLNGFEIGGGSLRNHEPDQLKRVFKILGYDDERIEANFGHMLTALGAGTPPHGGIAWGLDRLIALLAGEPNIREVIAFPKTGEGRDLMMNAPTPITPEQLNELGLRHVK